MRAGEATPDGGASWDAAAFARRATLGAWAVVVSNLLFALTDVRLGGWTWAQVSLLKGLQLAAAFGTIALFRRLRHRAAQLALVYGFAAAVCGVVALSGWLTQDVGTTVILCVAFAWGSATLLPWGPAQQAGVIVIVALAILLNIVLITGGTALVFSYSAVAVCIALAISLVLSVEFARQRRALAIADAERRAASEALEQRVRDRTAALQQANARLQDSVAAQREVEAALKAQERFVSAVLDTAGTLIAVLDPHGRIVQFNRACEAALEYTFDEVRGREFWHLSPRPGDRQAGERAFAALLAGTGPRAIEAPWHARSGQVRWFGWSTTFLHADDGSVRYVIATGVDISERRAAQRALRRREEHWRALTEHSTDLIGILGPELQIQYISPSIRTLLGFAPEEWRERPAFELVHPDDVAAVAEALRAGLEHRDTGEPLRFRVRHADGTWRTFEGTDTNLLDNESVRGIVVNLRDITDAVAAEDALRRSEAQHRANLEHLVHERTEQLRAANQELETFSYSVSHDLQVPLRHLKGFARILSEDHAPALGVEGQRCVERLMIATTRMERLIAGLLVLSRVTSAELRRHRVHLSRLASAVLAELRAAEPQRQVECVIAPDAVAEGDPDLLRIVLQNLIGNAWKYTARRAVAHIEFGVDERRGRRVFFVRDDGAGFDDAYAGELFTAFRRLHSNSEFEGSGIGLATVKRIVLRHGGSVWAEGTRDRGAAFFFTLGETR
ncbi:MAG: PAS domain S-box protein [Deltaproteobacteria bacterium]|nr:PAS domain S-box protein [Deltaproteobacteria bacterium]